ncbi:probable inactive receptor kinase At5g10020 isoform X2 [Rhodamnia argentea]|uniref:Probable inactive receptor kinase At5g10020 isoform X2 n=1 Tax=Rhodamnia argentea TaxID=178133 RepID=A0A8B8PL47_9MYRT|nr:probable inactive receptor kinase At5g10020 isoform X2 [Rhodamnia argentea]
MSLSLSLSCFFLFSLLVARSGSEPDAAFLLEFKKGIQDDPLGKVLGSWTQYGSDQCPSSWVGVTCDSSGAHVTGIALDRLGLAGELKFHTLIGLPMLQNLSLSGNNFTGRIAPALGSMASLQHLDLSGNSFYGPIPVRITDLYNLNYLNLSLNRFSGGFPFGIRNLQQMKYFDLRGNALRGDIGELLTELRNVEYVDLSGNNFSGSPSIGVQNVSSLANTVHFLNFSHNALNGGFFDADSIRLFRNLEVLDMASNMITGQLPSFGALPNLRVVRLANNLLFGSLPTELFESLIPLEELDLSGNGFTDSIPEINSTTLRTLNLSSNRLSGSLPRLPKTCTTVDLSSNMISSDISTIQNWQAPLVFLDLSSNNLSGAFPNLSSQFESLITLKLRNNSLVGVLPSLSGSYQKLSVVDLSLNEFLGTIPAGFFMSTLTCLNLSGNQLTGPIPLQSSHVSELLAMPTSQQMQSLDLSGNSLSGPLPAEIGNMGRLKLLSLARNGLSGQLPSELSKLTYLQYLDLSSNKFSGDIPGNLPLSLVVFNVSHNELSGIVPENLQRFPSSSFKPGNPSLILGNVPSPNSYGNHYVPSGEHRSSKGSIRIAIIVASVGAAMMIVFVLLAYHRAQLKEFRGRSGFGGQSSGRDVKLERFARPSLFKFHPSDQPPPTSLSFSNDHLLTSNSRSLSGQAEFMTEIAENITPEGGEVTSSSAVPNLIDVQPTTSGRKSSPGSPLSSSPQFSEVYEQPVRLDVYSPDRLAGELFFLDPSLAFTAEELSRAPAEVLGRSSHGTLYKATLDNGHMLTVKWLRVGLVKHKKEFAKEVKKIGSMRHPNIVPLRAYYWGPREQERLLLADYIQGDSLALHLYETTPRRYSPLSFSQRLKVAIDVARCLTYLHDKGVPHGNLKPTNILLTGPEYNVLLTDYGLHRLMTPTGIAEQILNLGALGYRAPELAIAAKPLPSYKADVYAFGVIMMELLTRRSAGDIISGQSGAVDLTDWVRLCDQEGRGMDCIDRDIAGGEEHSAAMDEMLAISLRCINSVNERPNVRQVFDELCAISL